MIRIAPAVAVCCGMAWFGPARADDTLLTVHVGTETRHYDREALLALPATTFTTETPWTAGPQHFTGVPVADLLEDAGIDSGAIHATAVNEYAITLEVDSLRPNADGDGPIIAYLLNGAEMSLRDKGPLWLVWPFDASDEFRTEMFFSGSTWQLVTIRHIPAAD